MTAISPALARRVNAGSGENAYKCYQCKRCSVGCPVAEFADLHPAQIMRAVQLGDVERAAKSRFIWLCTGCETCTTRCPQGIDIATIMDELRKVARERGIVHANAPFEHILKLNLDSMKRWGRLYEVELLALDKITRPSSFMDDVPMGIKMFLKGKISPLPTIGDARQMWRMAKVAKRIDESRTLKDMPINGEAAGAGLSDSPGSRPTGPGGAS
jgi:heterodisulfide reductase subunit C